MATFPKTDSLLFVLYFLLLCDSSILGSGLPWFPQGNEEWMFKSWHFIMSNKLEEATPCRILRIIVLSCWHCDWQHRWTDQWQVSWVHLQNFTPFATGIGHLITGLIRWDSLWLRLGFGLLHGSLSSTKHFVQMQTACEGSRDFICRRRHPWELLLSSWLQPLSDVCSEDNDSAYSTAWDGQGQTVVPKEMHRLYTLYHWLDTSQQVGFDNERSLLFMWN